MMTSLSFIAFVVGLAQFLDPVLKAYYWIGAGTTVIVVGVLMVRWAWRMEEKLDRYLPGVRRG